MGSDAWNGVGVLRSRLNVDWSWISDVSDDRCLLVMISDGWSSNVLLYHDYYPENTLKTS